eukprot:363203-Chlamydomonas_euryale.AAC.5
MKTAVRRARRATEHAADTEGTVCRGDPDTVTAVNNVGNDTPAPSGRGEVGGPMIPAGNEAALASCLGDSVAPAGHVTANSQGLQEVSVHMGQNMTAASHDGSGSNEQARDAQGEQQSKPRAAGRPKVGDHHSRSSCDRMRARA